MILLSYRVSEKKVCSKFDHCFLYETCFLPLVDYKIFSLTSVFSNLNMMYLWLVLFMFNLLGSCLLVLVDLWVPISQKFGKFSAMISSNIFLPHSFWQSNYVSVRIFDIVSFFTDVALLYKFFSYCAWYWIISIARSPSSQICFSTVSNFLLILFSKLLISNIAFSPVDFFSFYNLLFSHIFL